MVIATNNHRPISVGDKRKTLRFLSSQRIPDWSVVEKKEFVIAEINNPR
jgi:hypothetical protein